MGNKIRHKKLESKKSEKEAAKFFKGRRQPASGALRVAALKGDVISKKFLIEDKVTAAQQYTVRLKMFNTHSNNAWKIKRYPVLRIKFKGGPVLYVLEESLMSCIRTKIEQQENEDSGLI